MMKKIKFSLVFALSISFMIANAQEKKIKFNKGTLKICSSKNFQIQGYDGNEIIIKNLQDKSLNNQVGTTKNSSQSFTLNGFASKKKKNISKKTYTFTSGNTSNNKNNTTQSFKISSGKNGVLTNYSVNGKNIDISKQGNLFFVRNDGNRKKGLKKLGKKNENSELGINFIIEQKGDELIFKDNIDGQLIMTSNEKYEIKIPNSLRLNWITNGCKEVETESRKYVYFNSKASSLSNFNGEVTISTSLNNIKLKDVTGPVSVNTIGGNVTVEFDKKMPKKLYSIYSNNGFIDISLPKISDISLDVIGKEIFSDMDFKVLQEKEEANLQIMRLQLKKGKVKMKLNANLGNVYLRKKE